jgi:hypothetical protein
MDTSPAEPKQRRGLRGLLVIVAIVAVYLLIGLHFTGGRIMASSDSGKMRVHRTITVREGPGTPVWAWPLARINDAPQYRFEYFAGGNALWSCQSYVGESYTANRARIEWTSEDTATVYLDDEPIYTCTKGWWSDAKRR